MSKLLLLHGALAGKNQFDKIIPLIDKNLEPTAINFSGHGGSVMPIGGYTFDTFAKDILNYLEQNKIEKINLFGFSMGGYAAIYFAKLYPNKVDKIFTLNTKFNWDPTSTARETAKLNAEKILDKVPALANNLMVLHGMQIWKSVLKETEKLMNDLTKQVGLSQEDYAQLKTEILIGCSDKDVTATLAENKAVFELLPNAHFLCLPNTFHPFEQIKPDIIAPFINQFFINK